MSSFTRKKISFKMTFPPSKITFKRPVLSLPVPKYTNTEQPDFMAKLTDNDFKHLLLHYTGLECKEKEHLILLLRHLDKTEPKRVEFLKQFFDESVLFKFTPEPIPDIKLKNDSDKENNPDQDKNGDNSIICPKKRQKYDIPNIKETLKNVEKKLKHDSHTLLSLYEPILEVEAEAEIIQPLDEPLDSLLIRKNHLRKDIKHLFDWDQTTVPALSFRSLKKLIKYYDDLCINEKSILLDYISKLKMQCPDQYAILYDYTIKDKVLPDSALNDLEEFLNDSTNFEQIDSDDEYTLDDVMKTAVNNIKKEETVDKNMNNNNNDDE